ncbi:DNA-binding protein [Nocardia asteroides]|uniref:DNA-binding protein n=1 Tax=Nocardia asteroides TaxID=1824 RepID=UPI0034031EB4
MTAPTAPPLPLATPAEIANYRRTSTAVLAQERYRGEGPPYIRNGRSIRYEWPAVLEWIEQHTVRTA